MINTSLFILSVSLFTAMEAEEFIQKVENHSKKYKSFACTIVKNTTRVPIFDTIEEALKYETKRVKERYGFTEAKLAEDDIDSMIKNNARIYAEGEKGYPVYHVSKCLNMDIFTYSIFDTQLNQCVQVIYADNQYKLDYDPRIGRLAISRNNKHLRHYIKLFYHESMYNFDYDESRIEKTNSGEVKLEIIMHNDGKRYSRQFIFDNKNSFIPHIIIKKGQTSKVVYQNKEFRDVGGELQIPFLRFKDTYRSHPVTNKIEKKFTMKIEVEEFKWVEEMDKNDLDVEIPIYTDVHDITNNNWFKVTSEAFGETPTMFSILKNKDQME